MIHGENVFRDAVQIPNQREFFVSSQPFSKLLQMKIADIDLGPRPLFLAPMEDVTDPSFRYMCKRFGADMVYT